jgi:hypothetical protein
VPRRANEATEQAQLIPSAPESAERYRATVADHEQRPLLFLDVDGPLLPFGGKSPSGHQEGTPVSHLARLRPEMGRRLAALPCILVWATTWLEDANTEVAPRIGLPILPVVTWPEPTQADEHEDQWFGLCWKTRTLVNWAAGRPFVWVDDEITAADRQWVSEHHSGPALLRTVDAALGLTDHDFTAHDAWLRELS